MPESLVIIPTYNEKENIERIIRKVMSLESGFHVLVVDDGSPDGTGGIVKGLQEEFPQTLFIIEREGKSGLGTAYIAGFKWGLERNYELIYEMDADFSHNPDDLERLRAACMQEKGDFAIGSRYCKGGSVSNWDWKRILMSFTASLFVRIILWMPIRDTTAGFKCYRSDVLRALPLDSIKFVGYAFQIEMKYRSYRLGFRPIEVPITFVDRQFGESKMSMNIFKEAFWGVIKMRFYIR